MRRSTFKSRLKVRNLTMAYALLAPLGETVTQKAQHPGNCQKNERAVELFAGQSIAIPTKPELSWVS